MQAILVADYSFTPLEYWRGVSSTARDFIRRCLTVDPLHRMSSHDALSHPWIADPSTNTVPSAAGGKEDLLPTVKKNFNARRTLHAAIDTIRAINQLRAGGGAAVMDGARSGEPPRGAPPVPEVIVGGEARPEGHGNEAGADADKMDIDGRADGRGQTEEMIRSQERRIRETQEGMWRAR